MILSQEKWCNVSTFLPNWTQECEKQCMDTGSRADVNAERVVINAGEGWETAVGDFSHSCASTGAHENLKYCRLFVRLH